MSSARYFVETRWGGSEDEPTLERMRQIVEELRTKDEEHPECWLTHSESGWLLRLDEGRFAYLEDEDCETVAHLREVSEENGLRLWKLFADGGRQAVEGEHWISGAPVIPEEVIRAREERARQLTSESDRRFYELLGAERKDVPCKRAGCERGAISGSVLCRVHHFEQIYHRPCPFSD